MEKDLDKLLELLLHYILQTVIFTYSIDSLFSCIKLSLDLNLMVKNNTIVEINLFILLFSTNRNGNLLEYSNMVLTFHAFSLQTIDTCY